MKRYVHRYEAVKVPYTRVHQILESNPCAVVEPATEAGEEIATGSPAALGIGIEIGSMEVTKAVEIDVGELVDVAGRIPLARLPLRWRSADGSALFPIVEADIEIQPMPDDLTLVSFLGMYRPPLGPVGVAVDRFLLHRVAESAFHRFFEDVLHRLQHFEEVCGELKKERGSNAATG
jgi:hypothetical protein